MIIGIDASRANHEQKTGVEWYAFHLIQALKEYRSPKSEVWFILYSDEPLRGELAKLPVNWESKVLRWPPKRLWTQIRLSWEMLINSPDVLFIPAHVFPFIHPRKTVMTVHDVAALRFPESYNWFERWYSVFSAKMAVNKLWKVIVPSEFTKKELLTLSPYHLITLSHIFVIPHGYDRRYKKIENEIEIERVLEKYGVQKLFLMSVGRLEEKKNTVRIIEAFNKLKIENCKLKIIMIGHPGHGYAKVKDAIDKSPFKNDIITPGWVSPEDLPYIMNAAEVFVFPSLYEGFGLPILEAMACGVPVVASRGSSLEEAGGDAAMYVDPANYDEIARAIKELRDNQNLRQKKILKGFELVKNYDWNKCARETLNILIS